MSDVLALHEDLIIAVQNDLKLFENIEDGTWPEDVSYSRNRSVLFLFRAWDHFVVNKKKRDEHVPKG